MSSKRASTGRLAFTADASLTFKHSLYYSTKGVIPAAEVAEALLALDRIVQRAPRVLQAMAGGGQLPKVALYVERLEEGSLIEDVAVTLFFGSKEKMERTLKMWKEKLGVDLNTQPGMLRAILIALILVGAYKAADIALHVGDKPPAAASTVEIKDNIIINLGADTGISGTELVRMVDKIVTRKAPLAKDAIKVIAPAKKDPAAVIRFDNDLKLTIPRTLIDAVPDEYEKDDSTKVEIKKEAEIHLRAVDLDSVDKGWAAIVADVSSRRLRLELAPEINADDLFGKRVLYGDVEIISERDAHDRWQVKGYRLLRIQSDE